MMFRTEQYFYSQLGIHSWRALYSVFETWCSFSPLCVLVGFNDLQNFSFLDRVPMFLQGPWCSCVEGQCTTISNHFKPQPDRQALGQRHWDSLLSFWHLLLAVIGCYQCFKHLPTTPEKAPLKCPVSLWPKTVKNEWTLHSSCHDYLTKTFGVSQPSTVTSISPADNLGRRWNHGTQFRSG